MFDVPLLRVPYDDWYCPNCGLTERTLPLPPGQSRYHNCPRLHSLSAPLVRAGIEAKVTAELREDYLNGDVQATGDDGKVYMAIRVTRNDGDDLTVNAGLANVKMGF